MYEVRKACDIALKEIARYARPIQGHTRRSVVVYTGDNPKSEVDFVFGIERRIDPRLFLKTGIVEDSISFHLPEGETIENGVV